MSKKYTKKALTIEQQINLLKKRGLIINDDNKLKHYLNTVGYYCLSGYFKIFQNKDDAFFKNTTFERVLGVYFFDRKLRLLFLNALERIEKSFRTQFVYHITLKYGPYYFDEDYINEKDKEKISDILEKSKEPFIKNFQEKYSNESPPLWMLAEILSFGDILNFYIRVIENVDKKEIANYFNFGWKYLYSWLENLREVRNIAAHHSRLWNKKITKQLKKGKLYSELSYEGYVFDSIIVTAVILGKVSPNYEWLGYIKDLVFEYKIDVNKMGFPSNWESVFKNLKE